MTFVSPLYLCQRGSCTWLEERDAVGMVLIPRGEKRRHYLPEVRTVMAGFGLIIFRGVNNKKKKTLETTTADDQACHVNYTLYTAASAGNLQTRDHEEKPRNS